MKKLVDDSDQEMENQNDSKDSDLISDVWIHFFNNVLDYIINL
jgi:hypothetical protein